MQGKAYFEDFRVGDRLRTPGRTITEADVVMFTGMMGDGHSLPMHAAYAREMSYGERHVPYLLILALASGLMFRAGRHAVPAATIAIWGVDKVRFILPAKIGDTVHLESEVVRLTAVDKERGLLTVRHWGKNQRGEEVLTYTTQMLVQRRASPEGHSDG